MGNGRWDQPGMPHKGWRCVGVHDLGDGVGSGEEIDYAACEMCGNERIRFVHVMEHPDCDTQCEVGCICAEKLSDDYAGPKRRESAMKNRATRRARWLTRQWRLSAKGNRYLNIKGINVGVRRTGANQWAYWIGTRHSKKVFPTMDAARLALFDDYWISEVRPW